MNIETKMKFEWDENKRRTNLQRHGIDFADADLVFESLTATTSDNRFDYGETRYLTYGLLRGEIVTVIHTETDDVIRVISFRKATKYEQEEYFKAIGN